jgi:hypothetical protein
MNGTLDDFSNKVSEAINSLDKIQANLLSEDELIRQITKTIYSQFGFYAVVARIRQQEFLVINSLFCANQDDFAQCIKAIERDGWKFPLSNKNEYGGICNSAFNSGEIRAASEESETNNIFSSSLLPEITSEVCLPLKKHKRVIGTLELMSNKVFKEYVLLLKDQQRRISKAWGSPFILLNEKITELLEQIKTE